MNVGVSELIEGGGAAFRAAAGQVPTGVALVVAMLGGEPHAATAGSFVVVSAEPPLAAVFFATGTRMHGALRHAGAFTASVLRCDDHGLARRFSWANRPSGWGALVGVPLVRRDPWPPILVDAVAWFDCTLRDAIQMGDHGCFVADVVACGRDPAAAPLLYHRGRFHGLGPPAAPAAWTSLDRSDLAANW